MAIFHWSDDFSVHVEELDQHHKILVQMVNDLHEAMHDRGAEETLGTIIDGLVNFSLLHFTVEEHYFRKVNYPAWELHADEHARFAAKVSEFKEAYEEGCMLLPMDIMSFLLDWFVQHIEGECAQFGRYLQHQSQNRRRERHLHEHQLQPG